MNRITVARFGKEAFDNNDYGNALKHFIDYLSIMAEVKKCTDIYGLRTSHFDASTEITEMLMISHIYFEIARLYDSTPKFHPECKKALEQFVHFSVNQPYQVINSEMARKYLKKINFKNPADFRWAHEQIYIQSKKCYVVTYCFGTEHPITLECRNFKDWLLGYPLGQQLVRHYYNFSSVAVERWGQSPGIILFSRFLVRPALVVFSKTVLAFILRKC